jgi:hypothetical protein
MELSLEILAGMVRPRGDGEDRRAFERKALEILRRERRFPVAEEIAVDQKKFAIWKSKLISKLRNKVSARDAARRAGKPEAEVAALEAAIWIVE